MNDGRHIIWSNDLDYDDWKDDLEEQYPELSENERMELMYEINGDYLDDERINLNIQLSRPILVVGDLGLWNGRRMGYKEIGSGNIRDCLYSDTDYSTWYVDKTVTSAVMLPTTTVQTTISTAPIRTGFRKRRSTI